MNATSAIRLGEGADNRLYACAEWRHDSRTARRQMTDARYAAALRKRVAGGDRFDPLDFGDFVQRRVRADVVGTRLDLWQQLLREVWDASCGSAWPFTS
ncbi:hypothetical protein [Streptomyces sp. x-80]|uniref:hypothetical protein n=1 Tax=Streptomyces sp. x-80 TaxID=2789282 RepID=UPI0039814D40